MGRIVVEVMPKPEILDPQGKAVAGALPRLGFDQFAAVRQGRRFELTVDGEVTEEHLSAARDAAEQLLSNPVIEDVVVRGLVESSSAFSARGASVELLLDSGQVGTVLTAMNDGGSMAVVPRTAE